VQLVCNPPRTRDDQVRHAVGVQHGRPGPRCLPQRGLAQAQPGSSPRMGSGVVVLEARMGRHTSLASARPCVRTIVPAGITHAAVLAPTASTVCAPAWGACGGTWPRLQIIFHVWVWVAWTTPSGADGSRQGGGDERMTTKDTLTRQQPSLVSDSRFPIRWIPIRLHISPSPTDPRGNHHSGTGPPTCIVGAERMLLTSLGMPRPGNDEFQSNASICCWIMLAIATTSFANMLSMCPVGR
jgi:hypothetical protein